MLIFIDESGDPGFRLQQGSSPIFVFSMVIFTDFSQAELCSHAISEARIKYRIKQEFKFAKSHPNVRDGFFKIVTPFDFQIRSLVVDKTVITSPNLQAHTERFYNFFVNLLMKHDNGLLNNARIKLDGKGDRHFKQQLGAYIRKSLGKGKIKEFKIVESHKNNLIQLADMCAGAIARSYNPKVTKNKDNWMNILTKSGKIQDTWEFK